MGGGGSSKSITAAPSIASLRVSTAVLGRCVPWLFGTPRVSPNLIQHDDFTAIPHVERSQAGGKGGGGGSTDTTTYTYTAAIIMAMCRGPIIGVGRVWIGKEQKSTQQLNLDVCTGAPTQAAHPHWLTKHPDNALAYHGMAYVASAAYDLGDGGEVPSHNFEVFTPTRISSTNADANPAVVLQELITNKVDGLGLDVSKIGNLQLFSDFCMANGIWISPCYDEQQAAHELVERIAEIGHSAVVVSEGKIKLVPYADTAASGNGATFVPNTAPVYDLGEDDFLANGGQPIKITRSSQADADNHFQLTYYDRANEYNEATVEAQDQAHIEKFGLRTKEPDEYHEICDGAVAQKLVHFKKDRSLAIRNTYDFQLSLRYALLEPMDIVTITYAPDGLDRLPVRIIEIEEDDNGDLSIKAEECPLGSQSPTQQASQSTLAGSVDFNVGAGNVNAPVLFEPSLQVTRGSTEIWASVSGGQNWGGAQVWVSLDNDTYQKIGVVSAPSRQGVLTAALPAGSAIDNTNVLKISNDMSGGALLSATEQEALDLVTLCYADGELLAYKNAQLTGVNTYDLSYLVRGLYGTDPIAHNAGTKFARLDEATFKYPYQPEWVGRTVYLKFVSYNKFGAGEQSLADVTAYPYTINGAPLKPVTNLGFEKPWTGSDAKIRWDLTDGAARYDVEVWAGTPTALVRKTDTVTEGRFVYSLDMARIDGGTWRTMVFKVRPVSVTGNKGQWSQIMATNPQIGALQGFKFSSGMLAAYLEYTKPADADFAGVRVWLGTDANVATVDANCVYDGDASLLTFNKLPNGAPLDGGVTYYAKVAGYDTFGKDNLAISPALGFTVHSVAAMAKDLSESNLAASLKSQIELISGNGTGSVNARLSGESTQRAAAMSAEATARLAQINAESAARAAAVLAEAQARQLADTTESTARNDADGALSQRISTVSASADSNAAAIQAVNQATANQFSAQAQQLTTLAASLTGSGNLLPNAGFEVDINGWAAGWASNPNDAAGVFGRDLAGDGWHPVGMHAVGLNRGGTPAGSRDFGVGVATPATYIPVEPNARYCVSGWLASHRSHADIAIVFLDESRNTFMGEVHSPATAAWGGNDLAGWERKHAFVTAPAQARWAYVFVRQYAIGQTDLYTWVCRPMLERVSAAQTAPSPWSPSVVGFEAAITAFNQASVDRDGALSQRVDAVFASANTNAANINWVNQTSADRDGALGLRIDNVSVSAGNNAAAIQAVNQATANQFSAQAQQLTTLAASLTGSGNLLPNAGFEVDINGWAAGWASNPNDAAGVFGRDLAGDGWHPVGMHAVGLNRGGTPAGSRDFGVGVATPATYIPVEPNARYCVSGWLASHRSHADIAIVFLDESRNTFMGEVHSPATAAWGGNDLAGWERKHAFVTAPAQARWAYVFVRQYAIGQTDLYTWVCRPMLERVSAAQTAPSPWSPSVVGFEAAITAFNQASVDRDGALSQRVDAVFASANTNAANINWVNQTSADRDGALGLRIDNVSVSAGNNAAAIQAVNQASIDRDNARAQQISTVQTSVNGNTSSIQQQAVSINGLRAQSTLKLDVNGYVSGHGSYNDGVTSAFIINVDMFGVGAAGKGTSFPFVVDTAKNIVGVNGALLVDGTVHASAIVANSITGDKVAANSISTNHLQAGSISADKLMVGASSNMLVNAGFESDFYGWDVYQVRPCANNLFNLSADWCLANTSNKTHAINYAAGGSSANADCSFFSLVLAEAGKTYIAAAYVGVHRCRAVISAYFQDANGNYLAPANSHDLGGIREATEAHAGGKYLAGYKRIGVRVTAPANAVRMVFEVIKFGNPSADSWMFTTRPYAGECLPNQTELPPWDAAGATVIGAGNIKTDNLAAISANLGDITGGSLNINNRFIVAADGTATIRSGTSGQRTEMDSQQFRVYDANGTLRVRFGVW